MGCRSLAVLVTASLLLGTLVHVAEAGSDSFSSARRGHPLTQAQVPAMMHDLHLAAWLLPSRSSSPLQVVDELFRRAGMSPPTT